MKSTHNTVPKTRKKIVALTRECIRVLESNVNSIKEKKGKFTKNLNNPEGSISNKSYDSIKLLEWGLMQLQSDLEDYEKYDVNLLDIVL